MVKPSAKSVFREGIIIALVGAVLAFAANALSPKGLNLKRNYFPGDDLATASPSPSGNQTTTNGLTNVPVTEENIVARLKAKGLQPLGTSEVKKLFDDIRYQQSSLIFIDVRSDHEYEEGHIPGAHHFDYYYPQNDVGPVVAACQPAEQIVVYCGGGKCDASEQATLMLRDNAGIAANKLFLYTGGMTEWKEKNFPVETGPRNSGKLMDSSHGK